MVLLLNLIGQSLLFQFKSLNIYMGEIIFLLSLYYLDFLRDNTIDILEIRKISKQCMLLIK